MQMKMTYLPAEHKDLSPGTSVAADAFDPNAGVITTELNSKLYNEHLNEMAEQGYQLLSVQPVHRVEYTHIQNVSVIGGFYFFWQKSTALAFPMGSEFPGFPAAKTPDQTIPEVAAPVQKIAAKSSPTNVAVPINAHERHELSDNETNVSSFKNADSESSSHRESNKFAEHNEPAQESEQDSNVDSRVSTIKKLLQEKSSKKGNKLNPQSIEIPPEANTQLLKNIEDLHNLGRTATSRKDKNPGRPKNPDTDSKPHLNSESDEHLDLDLDLDFDFDDIDKTPSDPHI